MKISGKYTIAIIFLLSLVLAGITGWVAMSSKSQSRPIGSESTKQPRGYRPKFFQTFENARATAEKTINQDPSQKNIITKYESTSEGWMFHFESLKYLTSGNPADRNQDYSAILVRPDQTTSFIK